jgi:predicted transcriptional regulator
MSPKTTTTIRIDDALLDGLQYIRQRDGIPVSEQIRRAIQDWLRAKGVSASAKRRPKAQ